MKNLSYPGLLLFVLIILVSFSCNTTEPPPPPPPTPVVPKTLKLELLDVTFTEAYIKVEALTDTILPVQINLKKNNLLLYTFTLASKDTVITDTTLQANTSYSYQAVRVENGTEGEDKSDTLQVKTLTTTSHNFTWQIYTFGENSSSQLNDVAIIDENNIWAVGEIYMNDSTGQPDPQPYNLAKWEGNNWKLDKLSFPQFNYDCSIAFYGVGAIRAIFAINDNNILFTDGLSVARWDGNKYTFYPCVSLSIIGNGRFTKIWGISENNFYCVGTNGTIFHYLLGHWTKIESGTTTTINDIWGYQDIITGDWSVLAVASNLFSPGDHKLLVISGNQAKDTLNYTYGRRLAAVWCKNNYSPLYTCGDDIMVYNKGEWKIYDFTGFLIPSIRGNDINDVVAIDQNGGIFHYNGITWQTDESLRGQNYYNGIAIKGNTIIAVGSVINGIVVGSAAISVGKR